jgi:hypothetical protein
MGTMRQSQGTTLKQLIIDCRARFWEHARFCVALSWVKSHSDLCILHHPDMDNFTVRPRVDLEAVHILETMNSSNAPSTAPLSLKSIHSEPLCQWQQLLALETYCAEFFLITGSESPIHLGTTFVHSPFESRILPVRFFVLYRVY